MTDNEIIRAFTICKESNWCCDESCPFFENCNSQIMAKYALDLINRQKAQIEALQMDNEQLRLDSINANMNCEHLSGEVERLRGWSDLLKAEKHSLIKSEAIKEFGERLKAAVIYDNTGEVYLEYNAIDYNYLVEEIDSIVKEMTEGKDNA